MEHLGNDEVNHGKPIYFLGDTCSTNGKFVGLGPGGLGFYRGTPK